MAFDTPTAIAYAGAFAGLVGGGVAIRKEREADWPKIKFEHYKEFMTALASIVGSDATPDGHRRFAQACNTVQLVSSKEVIEAVHDYRGKNSVTNPRRSIERVEELLSKLVRAMRADVGIRSASNPAGLSIQLWVSGVNEE